MSPEQPAPGIDTHSPPTTTHSERTTSRVSQHLSQFLGRIPLGVQLVVVLLSLSALALTLFGAAAVGLVRAQMVGQVDQKLREATQTEIQAGTHDWDDFAGHPSRGMAPKPEVVVITTDTGQSPESYAPSVANRVLQAVPDQSRAAAQSHSGKSFTAKDSSGSSWRVLMSSVALTDGNYRTVTSARQLDDVNATVGRLVTVCISAGVLLLLLLAGLGYALIHASLRPLVQVENTAAAIAAGDLSQRVPQRDPRTEVGRLSAALNGMLARIESAFSAQAASEANARASEERMRRFIADASHELRTPLTSISGFTELHAKGGIPDDQLPTVMQRMHAEAKRMGLLVEDLLLLARLDQQRPLQRRDLDLSALVADVVDSCATLATDHHLEMDPGEPDPTDAPVHAMGDEHRLRQVVLNLVTNALRHTPAGSHVQVAVRRDAETPATAVITVSDDGPGLTPEQANHVFERFYRADPSRTRAAGGSGLGLSIVSAIVAAHGGQVSVGSTPGQGAVFTVCLPQA